MPPQTTRVSYEMTLDRAEFLRLLPGASGHLPFRREEDPDGGTVLTRRDGVQSWRIQLAPLPPLRLGALALDRLRVDLTLDGYSPGEAEGVVACFLLHFQRGGG